MKKLPASLVTGKTTLSIRERISASRNETGTIMPKIALGYGRGSIKFDHDSARFDTLAPEESPAQPLSDAEIEVGTTIEVNRALKDFSKIILTGAIGFHYFAGFTGGRKSICPGLASARTIEATHMLALDFKRGGRRAGVGAGLLKGNAVNEACERVAAIIDPAFLVNAIVDERGRVEQVFGGRWRVAHARHS